MSAVDVLLTVQLAIPAEGGRSSKPAGPSARRPGTRRAVVGGGEG